MERIGSVSGRRVLYRVEFVSGNAISLRVSLSVRRLIFREVHDRVWDHVCVPTVKPKPLANGFDSSDGQGEDIGGWF